MIDGESPQSIVHSRSMLLYLLVSILLSLIMVYVIIRDLRENRIEIPFSLGSGDLNGQG